MNRWTLALLAAATLAASTRLTRAQEGASAGSSSSGPPPGGSSGDLRVALRRFLALPGTKSYLIQAGADGALDKLASDPDRFLFTASAYKTFVLGRYLRDVEAGVLSEDEQVAIDDSVRMFGSPVLQNLAGTTQARSVLDAMISYSDNTATDL